MVGSFHQDATLLFGRDKELELLDAFVDQSSSTGDAFLLSGAPGVGKTVLLDAAAAHAAEGGVRVLRSAGAEFEADLSFAGLNQVLHPLFDEIEGLNPPQRAALEVALGLGDGPAPDQLMVCNAGLSLLAKAASKEPLLVIVDDLQWVDRASALVLGFVARRLHATRVGFLAASRSGDESFFERSGLRGHDLDPLDDAASTALLADRFPALAPRVRQRLLAESQGNPLALLELPAALTSIDNSSRAVAPQTLPLSERLQAVFASRITGLPAASRHLLLLAVLDGTGDLGILQSASGQMDLEGLGAAERARLVRVDPDGRLAFRHPLTRSAVTELSTSSERRDAHRALAPHVAPERRAWHLAEATVGCDEAVASLLEETARKVLRRGDAVAAINGLLRAAEMSPAAVDRGRRLAEAVYLGANFLGDLGNAPVLLDAVRASDPVHAGSLAGAMAAAYHLLNGVGDVDTAHRLLVGAIETCADPSDASNEVLVEAIYNLYGICFCGGRAELWEPFDRALGRLKPRPPELLELVVATLEDPARRAAPALGRLDEHIAELSHDSSPAQVIRIAIACGYSDRIPEVRSALWRLVEVGRDGGVVTFSIQALALLGMDAYLTGRWDEVQKLTDEAIDLCDAHGYVLRRWPHRSTQAMLAAGRGDREAARAITDGVLQWAVPRRAKQLQFAALHARVLDSLAGGDFERAFQDVCVISPAGTIASHVPQAMWVVMDLVEAAVHTGRREEAIAHVQAARDANLGLISSRLALLTEGSAGIAATELDGSFEKALAIPGAELWAFDLARVQLVYGERLRRAKETTAARPQLAAALDAFERLGAHPWAQRAANELRATGITVGRPKVTGPEALSPQQLEIARLAATGLSNKEIGERLFLSRRTVSTHLYQIFPKLGISSRAALRDALEGYTADT